MNKNILILFFSFHVLVSFGQGENIKLDSLINTYYKTGDFNGSILIASNGELLLKKGYGLANFEWNILNTSQTVFQIGSLTKQFTSMLIMQLVEDHQLDINAKISEYLPDFNKTIADSVTVFHLLTHTSGLIDYTSEEFWQTSAKQFYTYDYLMNNFCGKGLKFTPGTQFSYTNAGYILLGCIIEKVTNNNFEDVLYERILHPLGMKNTGMFEPSEIIPQSADGYIRSNDKLVKAPYIDFRNVFAAGGMYSTVEDLFLWDKALYTNILISEEYKEMIFKPNLNNYGLGWGILDYENEISEKKIKVVAHKGRIKGYKSILFRMLNDQHTIIILDNTYTGNNLFEMCEKIMNILYNENNN